MIYGLTRYVERWGAKKRRRTCVWAILFAEPQVVLKKNVKSTSKCGIRQRLALFKLRFVSDPKELQQLQFEVGNKSTGIQYSRIGLILSLPPSVKMNGPVTIICKVLTKDAWTTRSPPVLPTVSLDLPLVETRCQPDPWKLKSLRHHGWCNYTNIWAFKIPKLNTDSMAWST